MDDPAAIDAEYRRVLTIRGLLRVEEMVTELQIGEHSASFRPRIPHRRKLIHVRALVWRACQGLLHIEKSCQEHGLDLDFGAIDRQHYALLSGKHPIRVLETYFDKTYGIEDFANFQDYYDQGELDLNCFVDGCSHEDDGSDSSDSDEGMWWPEYIPLSDEEASDRSSTS